MLSNSSKNLCLFHILDGLRQGLSSFSGPSRAAVIFAERPDDPISVYDPQDLLRGHEPLLKEIYLDSEKWYENPEFTKDIKHPGQIFPEKNLELSGLISRGARTRSVYYQMWFTEHHPNICSIGPTERWLEHAAFLLSLDFTIEGPLYSATSGSLLREYATHAVRDYILDEICLMFGWDIKIFVLPILDAILGISKTREEGAWPRGKLVFISPDDFSKVDFLVRFPTSERPSLQKHKHVRKLLQAVECSNRRLISFGNHVVGIAAGDMPKRRSTADFRGDFGFLKLAGQPVCSFSDGNVYSSTQKPNLVNLEEALLEFPMDTSVRHTLFKIVNTIVHDAGKEKHGCTLVIDLNPDPVTLSGQPLEHPMDLKKKHLLNLANALAKLDGALHLRGDLHLHGFACLLHGSAMPGEDRARGARFNSALRFSAEHRQVIVVVVSSDKPVSVIQEGVELTAQCEWAPFSKMIQPSPSLANWIAS
jgi:Probable sensor domain DACND/Probable sensor domain DACNH/DisA bacterial checkpoint controller nucleotide-binding